jgi:riboflavin kinase / FMN adenylyltransferase
VKIWTDIKKFSAKNPVVTVGIFDGVHFGHRKLLEHIKSVASEMNGETVVVTLWPHPRLVLNASPETLRYLTSLDEKTDLIEKHGIEHLVILPFTKKFAELKSWEFIKTYLVDQVGMKSLIVGFDHRFGRDREGDYKMLLEYSKMYDFSIEKMSAVSMDGVKISSSLIRELLNSDELSLANKYLGYDYFLEGKVIGGNRIGRKIGFPTANINPLDQYKLIPRDGVYAVHIEIDHMMYEGMLNIGYRPTIEKGMALKTIEVNLFDFTEDIYAKNVRLFFRKRLRNEMKFEGIKQLSDQLIKDKEEAQKILKEYKD